MIASSIKALLLVEDNHGDVRLLREMFNDQSRHPITLHHAETVAEAEQFLSTHVFDMVLLDLGLPDAQGLEAVRRIHSAAPAMSLVILTAHDDERLACQAMQEGAQDYLIKGQIEAAGLLRALSYAAERKQAEVAARALSRKITHLAEHDFLTGLPNRVLLNDRIGVALAFAAQHSAKAAVLFLDLDGFKHVNDSLGHTMGDKLLQSVTTRLMGCVRAGDTVSRQGGDEFVVLLTGVERTEDAALIGKRMLDAVKETHSIDGHELHITTSIGISVYPDDGKNAETLIRAADVAMYQAKEMGRQSLRFFTPAMNDQAMERQSLEEDLRCALERGELSLRYRPKIRVMSGAVVGAEALLRWTHPTRGIVPPAQFISIAEECGLIRPIGDWVLRETCQQAQAWLEAGLKLDSVAVNVSAVQFTDESFPDRLMSILGETKLSPKLVELELTEDVLMKHAERTGGSLQRLRERGVQIAIDAFGTGYTSLTYLQRFPVDMLKIDASFVRHIGEPGHPGALVAAIVGMARALNLSVVAQGVKTREQLDLLRDIGCDEAQGTYFPAPSDARSFARLLGLQVQKPLLRPVMA
jgi:diguanylate cyclase (GGDEF)-like protein